MNLVMLAASDCIFFYRASQIESARSSCPNTKLIVAGYSQGCQIVHNAVSKLSADTASWISKVLLFGDPGPLSRKYKLEGRKKGMLTIPCTDDGQALPNVDSSKVHTVCHDGDDICKNGIFILPPHLTYALDVASAAAFAIPSSS